MRVDLRNGSRHPAKPKTGVSMTKKGRPLGARLCTNERRQAIGGNQAPQVWETKPKYQPSTFNLARDLSRSMRTWAGAGLGLGANGKGFCPYPGSAFGAFWPFGLNEKAKGISLKGPTCVLGNTHESNQTPNFVLQSDLFPLSIRTEPGTVTAWRGLRHILHREKGWGNFGPCKTFK